MTPWHTPDTVRDLHDLWPDASALDDSTLTVLLGVAREQVIAYAPALPPYLPDPEAPEPEQVPDSYALAQLIQAKNMWNAGRVDASGGIGDGADFVIRPTPLDWHVKQILRPKRGAPRVR